ncbi:hypothetical protein STCU_12163 [Strigomonas culicis]|uniref:Uncharacterized protein n=1 Tax=Strigomonas culicis TaxID=28005 RepID=S9TG08_9TRYP|nr:hypothetical protein STCU_12163 [Strigomonas culicis]|eukprot:EPY15283.1 hypothetical protein STCU_12163 [Strigomonas culicis]
MQSKKKDTRYSFHIHVVLLLQCALYVLLVLFTSVCHFHLRSLSLCLFLPVPIFFSRILKDNRSSLTYLYICLHFFFLSFFSSFFFQYFCSEFFFFQ